MLGEGRKFSLGLLPLFFLLACNPVSDRDIFFDAVQKIETGGEPDPMLAIGLAGELGPYQITYDYWEDSYKSNPLIGGTFEDVKGYAYGQQVIGAYMERYALDAWNAGDYLTCSRIHHGGPRGMEREHTIRYAERVLEEIAHRTSAFTLEIGDDSESTRDREGSATLLGRSDGGL